MPHPIFRKKPISELIAASSGEQSLKKVLKPYELILFGIGAVIGTGIFVVSGIAAELSGPALPVSFIIAGIVCIFAALCYAELAAMVPVTGSAYTYSYAAFGEIWAWIIGWDLILEYSVAVSAVAIGWSGYLANLLGTIGIVLPAQLVTPPGIDGGLINLPALLIILGITGLLIIGTKESARVTGVIVAIKIAVLLLFIALCIGHIQSSNYALPMPHGWGGVVSGAALVFFAFIGFDAVVVAAEETDNPQRNLPIAIIGSLLVCMIVYIAVAAMLISTVPYVALAGQAAPIAFALNSIGIQWGAALISVGALCGMTTVLLVNLYGQSRIFFAMSRDKLLPSPLSKVNRRFGTPVNVTLLVGVITALLAGFSPLMWVAELVNIGALAAFMIVAFGVIYLRYKHPEIARPFRCPLVPQVPVLCILTAGVLIAKLDAQTHIYFVIWMLIGILVYFLYYFVRKEKEPSLVGSPNSAAG